jgi:hypothetical protein
MHPPNGIASTACSRLRTAAGAHHCGLQTRTRLYRRSNRSLSAPLITVRTGLRQNASRPTVLGPIRSRTEPDIGRSNDLPRECPALRRAFVLRAEHDRHLGGVWPLASSPFIRLSVAERLDMATAHDRKIAAPFERKRKRCSLRNTGQDVNSEPVCLREIDGCEIDTRFHQSRHEMNVSGEPIQFRDDQRRTQHSAGLERFSELRPV